MENNQFKLEESPGFMVARTFKLLRAALRDVLDERGVGVTPEQWAILSLVGENEGVSQKELAQSAFKDVANVARIVEALERKALLRRETDPQDRRAKRLFCTPAGQEVRARAADAARETNQRMFGCLSPGEMETLVDFLHRIYEHAHPSHI
jgi:DNA-binding MarR family transcriptional regulator